MAKLGINGKVVDIINIASKTKAQFKAQLKQAGVVLDEDRLESVYTQLHNEAVDAEAVVNMTDSEKKAYFAERYPELSAESTRIRQQAQMEAEKMKAAMQARAASLAKINNSIKH